MANRNQPPKTNAKKDVQIVEVNVGVKKGGNAKPQSKIQVNVVNVSTTASASQPRKPPQRKPQAKPPAVTQPDPNEIIKQQNLLIQQQALLLQQQTLQQIIAANASVATQQQPVAAAKASKPNDNAKGNQKSKGNQNAKGNQAAKGNPTAKGNQTDKPKPGPKAK